MAPSELLQITKSYQDSIEQSRGEVISELGQYLRTNINAIVGEINQTGSATLLDKDRKAYVYTREQLIEALS